MDPFFLLLASLWRWLGGAEGSGSHQESQFENSNLHMNAIIGEKSENEEDTIWAKTDNEEFKNLDDEEEEVDDKTKENVEPISSRISVIEKKNGGYDRPAFFLSEKERERIHKPRREEWRNKFPEVEVKVLPRVVFSDHNPILIQLWPYVNPKRGKAFKFIRARISDSTYPEVIKHS
ncbi:hypothetical protein RJT34_12580 [Clitoria ternatea]|uniref:Uncharacterized protein n=1 Tax=Clitoria ternatea TaxID=43366 RepID=A0AAN9JPP3_CLITE